MSRSSLADVPPEILEDRQEERDDEREEACAEGAGSGVEFDFAAVSASIEAGTAVIRRAWATLPTAPGVYRMIDRRGDVLYVGKAKSLKARVGSYIRDTGHSTRISRMIAETGSMVFVTTETETEALLLEANLIKQMRPRYNVVLRDDKSLPYILVTEEGPAPQVVKHRGARNRKGRYFGPFASVWAVNRTINALQRAFLLRSCSDSYYENRTRPCLLHQIKRCSGPCTGEIEPDEYAKLVGEALDFLSGRSSAVKERMAAEMGRASDDLEFERAARYRDRLAALSAVQSTQGVNTQSLEEADVFAIDEQAGQFCVEVFFFRNNQNWGNRAYFPRADRSHGKGEVMAAFLAQFYDDKPPPRAVLIFEDIEECELLASALAVKAGRRVEIAVPKRGERRALVEAACRNAKEALGRRLAETASQGKLLGALGTAFGLESAPRRIEIYDNSHIMGANAVGGMVVAGPSGFMKTHYRTFNMRSDELAPGDDYGMMREMLRRRFARLAKEAPRDTSPRDNGERSSPRSRGPGEGPGDSTPDGMAPGAENPSVEFPCPSPARAEARLDLSPQTGRGEEQPDPEAFPAWPDLVLVDGGKGQLDAARATLAELGITDVPLVGVAKGRDRDAGRETFFMPGRPPIRLPPRDPALYFVQRLRDEAHRFAISAHRGKRKRDMSRGALDEIPGVGPSRKRALLHHFGTMKAIERAGLDDLRRAPGVNAATAQTVFDYFHAG